MVQEIRFSSRKYNAKKLAEFLVKSGSHPKTTKKDGINIEGSNVKHIWSGKQHIFYIPDYLDSEKVKKYAQGYASGALSDKSFGWDLKKTVVKQPFDARGDAAPMVDAQGNIIYETTVERKEQIADIQAWAKDRGATVERVYAGSAEEAKAMKDTGGIPILIKSKDALPENVEIMITSPEAIRQEKARQMASIAGKKVYEEAGPVEKSLLHLHTVLSPQGYAYIGAAARESAAAQPYNIQAKVTGAAMDLIFPNIKTTKEVVVDNVSSRIERHAQGEYTYSFDLPVVGRVNVDERIVEAINNPVVDVEVMFLGGAGLAKVAATKTGGKILTSTAGKALMTVGGAAYVGSSGYEVYTLRQEGKGAEALGKAITRTSGLVAGAAGFKMQQAHILQYSAPKKIEVDLSKIRGVSKTAQNKDVTISRGKFEITEGKLRGLRGDTLAITQKKDGALIVKIPAQKVGGQKIEAGTFVRHTKAGETLKAVQGKIFTRISKEGRLIIETSKGQLKGPLLGKHTDKTYIKEIGRVTRTGTDRSGRQSSLLIRRLEGLNIGKSSKNYNIFLVRKGNQVMLLEAKAGIANPRVSKIDWIDVSKLSAGGKPFTQIKPGSPGTVIRPGTAQAPSIKSVAVPPGSVKLSVKADLGARVVPTVNPTPTGVRIKDIPQGKTLQRIAMEPSIIRREQSGKIQGRTVIPTAVKTSTPQIERATEKARITYKPISTFYHPITGNKVSEQQFIALKQAVEPVIDRINPQPVPATPVIPSKLPLSPPGLLLPPMIPFLRLGTGKAKPKVYTTSHIKNPVPDIRKVI